MKIILILAAPPEAVPADARRGDAAAWRVYLGSSPDAAALAERLFTLPEAPSFAVIWSVLPVKTVQFSCPLLFLD